MSVWLPEEDSERPCSQKALYYLGVGAKGRQTCQKITMMLLQFWVKMKFPDIYAEEYGKQMLDHR